MTSKHDPISLLTHDLRQPLHAVLLYLDALDRRTEREDARDILGKARAAARSLSGQLDALSLHNRLNRDEIAADIAPVLVHDVIQSTLKKLDSNIAAACENVADTQIKTDERVLAQILDILVRNAAARGDGASVTAQRDGGGIVFFVGNTGAAERIADDARDFTPFTKANANDDDLGLGLSNAAGLAKTLGASLTIEADQDGRDVFALRGLSFASA